LQEIIWVLSLAHYNAFRVTEKMGEGSKKSKKMLRTFQRRFVGFPKKIEPEVKKHVLIKKNVYSSATQNYILSNYQTRHQKYILLKNRHTIRLNTILLIKNKTQLGYK